MTPSEIPDTTPAGQEARERLRLLLLERQRSERRSYPATSGQRALWLHQRLDPNSAAYNLRFSARVTGGLRHVDLLPAVRRAMALHPALRARFRLVGDRLMVEVSDSDQPEATTVDSEGWDDDAVRAHLNEKCLHAFDLEQGPLVRVDTVSRGDELFILVTVHHIVGDIWSLGLLLREVLAGLNGAASKGSAESLDYSEHARSENEWLAGKTANADREYWTQRLEGSPVAVSLAPSTLASEGARRVQWTRFELGHELSNAVASLAAAEGTTAFAVLLTAAAIVMHHRTGTDHLVFGSVSAGRHLAGSQSTIGYFASPFPVVATIHDDDPFAHALALTYSGLTQDLAHARLPYPEIVSCSGAREDANLIRTSVVLESAPGARRSLLPFAHGGGGAPLIAGDLVFEPFDLPSGVADQEAVWFIEHDGEQYTCSFQYDVAAIPEEVAQRISVELVSVLSRACAAPGTRVGDLRLLTEQEERTLWQPSTCPDPSPELFTEAVVRWAVERPDSEALVSEDDHLDYKGLARRTHEVAARLAALGLPRGSRIGVHLDGGTEAVIAVLGVLQAGYAFVPLDAMYPAPRIAYIAENSDIALFLGKGIDLSLLEGIGALTVSELLTRPEAAPYVEPGPEDVAYVCYTSGSTGRPKGVVVEHRNLAYLIRGIQRLHNRLDGPGDHPRRRVLQFASPAFDAMVWDLVTGLGLGNTLVVVPRERRRPGPPLVETVSTFGVTSALIPPSSLSELDPRDVPGLVEVISAGEALPADVVDRWATEGRVLLNGYGPTECTVVASVTGPVEPGSRISIGGVVDGAEFYILDASRRPVPLGVAGELCIGGNGVSRGYQGLEKETANRFFSHPLDPSRCLYATGDIVRAGAPGVLEYIGRVDDQVKIRGFRVEPGEVTDALTKLPGVHQAAVIADRAGSSHAQLIGFVTPRDESVTDGELLRLELASVLPSYLVPNSIHVLAEFPLTPQGKVDRHALLAVARRALERTAEPPATPGEVIVADVWRQVLGTTSLSRDDDFFRLGGNSLLALQVRGRLAEATGTELPVETFFEASTLRGLAERFDDAARGAEPVRSAGSGATDRLSYAQLRLWLLHRMNPEDRAYVVVDGIVLDGTVDMPALVESCNRAVERHDALHTVFQLKASGPVRVLRPPSEVGDIRVVGENDDGRLVEELSQPFDLASETVRIAIVDRGAKGAVLYVSAHHATMDGIGVAALLADIGTVYTALCRGLEPPPVDAAPYQDYVDWQRGLVESGQLDDRISALVDELEPRSSALALPRGHAHADDPGVTRLVLSTEQDEQIRDVAKRVGVTVPVIVLTAVQVVLARWHGANDFAIGVPLIGRPSYRFERTVGMFTNALPVASITGDATTTTEAITLTQERLVRALANQDVPFELLVERLAPQRDDTRPPIFQVMFNQLDMTVDAQFEGLSVVPLPPVATGAKYDLTVYCYTNEGRLTVTAAYDTTVFDKALAEEFLQSLSAVLEDLSDGDAPLDSLASLDWNGRDDLPCRTSPLDPLRRLHGHAVETPDATALAAAGGDITYRELEDRVAALSDRLTSQLTPGSHVMLLGDRSADTVVSLLAALRAMLVIAVVDRAEPGRWLLRAARATGCRLTIEPHATSGQEVRRLDTQEEVPLDSGGTRFPTLNVSGDAERARLALLTSATTGVPRAVISTLDPLLHYLGWATERFMLTRRDRVGFVSGVGHDPMLRDVLLPLCAGGTCVIPTEETLLDPDAFARWLSEEQVTVLHITPARARILLRASEPVHLPLLRLVIFGGERLSASDVALIRALAPSAVVVNGYGATETPQLAAYQVVESPESDPVPVGAGIDGTELVVARGGAPARTCEIGEIVVRSRHLAEGYLGDIDDEECFGPDPAGREGVRVFRTGDLGRALPGGIVECLGRADGVISIRGHRIDPRQVESALRLLPGVQDALVIDGARVNASLDGMVIGYVVTEGPFDALAMRRRLAQELPRHLVPHLMQDLPAIPLTSNGKVDEKALPVPSRGGHVKCPPRTAAQRAVAELWEQVLGTEILDVDAGFFEMGGHSLQLVDLQQRMKSVLGVEVGIVDLYRLSSVAAQAELLRTERSDADRAGARTDAVERARRRVDRRRGRSGRVRGRA